mgnify:CR=1 FL=1
MPEAIFIPLFQTNPGRRKVRISRFGWMDEIVKDELHGKLSDEDYAKRIESVRRFERQLTDNGYLVMKFSCISRRKSRQKGSGTWSMKKIQSGASAKMISGRTVIMRSAKRHFLPI